MNLVYFSLSVICFVLGWLSRGKLFNPLSAFSAIWILVVALSNLMLSGWQRPINDSTYMVLIAMQISFAILYIFGNGLRLKEITKPVLRLSVSPEQLNSLFKIWLAIEIIEILYSGGLPILWHLLGTGKTYFDFGIPSVHGLMNSLGLVILLIASLLILDGKDENHHFRRICIFIFLFYLCLVTRQVIVSAGIELIIVIYLRKPQLIIHKLVPVALLSIILFGVVGNLRTGYEAFMYVSLIRSDIPELFVGFYWVYMYLSMTITNINNLVAMNLDPVGMNALSGFIPTVFAPLFGIDTGFFTADYLVTSAFNVSGFFVYFYQGFSILGVIVISAAYGLIGGISYRKFSEDPCERNILLLAIAMQIVLLSFFDNMLLYLPSSFQFVVVLLLYRRKSIDAFERINYLSKKTDGD